MDNNSYIVDYFIYISYIAMAVAFFSVVYFVFKKLNYTQRTIEKSTYFIRNFCSYHFSCFHTSR